MRLWSNSIKPLWLHPQVVQDFSINQSYNFRLLKYRIKSSSLKSEQCDSSKEGSTEPSARVPWVTYYSLNGCQIPISILMSEKRPHQSLAGFAQLFHQVDKWALSLKHYHHSLHAILIPYHTSLEGQNLYFYILFKSSGLYNEYYQQTGAHKFLSSVWASPHLW